METNNYKIVTFPKSRIGTFDVGIIGNKKHHVAAFLELDITEARKLIKAERKEHKISFTAWLLKTIAGTLINHKEICGYLQGKRKKIVFDNISITVTVEKNISGVNVPIPLLIEDVNLKPVEEITDIINRAKSTEIDNENNTVINNKFSNLSTKLYYLMPRFIRIKIMEKIVNNPFTSKKAMGNVMFTSIGIVGKVSGWILPKSYHNLCFAMGSIIKKPWVVNDKIEIREIANMTILVNHDVVDGMPMARFVSEFSDKVQNIKEI